MKGFIPTSVLLFRISPCIWGVSLWEGLEVVVSQWSFPTTLGSSPALKLRRCWIPVYFVFVAGAVSVPGSMSMPLFLFFLVAAPLKWFPKKGSLFFQGH